MPEVEVKRESTWPLQVLTTWLNAAKSEVFVLRV
jgi:hypothetical protein